MWREPATRIGFVKIPPGQFLMGSSEDLGAPAFDPEAAAAETPAHEVELPYSVGMAEHPVTNAQYGRFLAAAKYPEPAFWQNPRFNAPEQPVVGVSFDDAMAFCTWLTARVELPTGYCFELPTEAEWEYAARGSDGRRYPWGNEDPTTERAWFNQPFNTGATAPVGERPAGKSPFGCHDMAGNVWEWCLDAWVDDYGSIMAESVSPCQPGERGASRIVRGGFWGNAGTGIRCASRSRGLPGGRFDFLSFRVVCRSFRQSWLVEY